MKKNFKAILVGIMVIGISIPLTGQDLQQTLEDMAESNARGYLGPVVTAFGMGVNSGTFHTAKPHKMLGFDVKLNVALTTVTDVGQDYDFALPDADIDIPLTLGSYGSFTVSVNPSEVYEADRTSSTFFGEDKSNEITVDSDLATNTIADQLAADSNMPLTADQIKSQFGSDISGAISNNIPSINTPKGFNVPYFPMVMPQASVGLPMDIELTLRGVPEIDMGEAGKISFYGFGGKIGINQFIPIPNLVLPQFSVGYYMTNLNLAEILEANNSIATLQVSKSIPFLTVYGGVGLESSSMDVSYMYVDELTGEEIPIEFSLDGDNGFRALVGFRLKLAVISINADYNIGEFNTANVGVGFTLR